MSLKQTYDTLKYGAMHPDKVRYVVETYLNDSRPNLPVDWYNVPITGATESKCADTLFFKIWVYHDTNMDVTMISFVPRYLDHMPSVMYWSQVSQGIVALNVSEMSMEEVYMKFHEFFEELNHVCFQFEEQENNSDTE